MTLTGRRPFRRYAHLVALDLVAAVAVLLVLAPSMRTAVPIPAGAAPPEVADGIGGTTWALAIAAAAPIVMRRRWPLPTLGVLVVVTIAGVLVFDLRWPDIIGALAGVALALYSVASTAPGRISIPALLVTLAIAGGVPAIGGSEPSPSAPWADTFAQIGFGLLMLGVSWTAGVAVRQRRAYAARSAQQAAAQALADERRRIARELHDVVAHSMSLIAVKAGIANHVAESKPDEAREALRLIEGTSRSALVDLRRVLDVLRADPAPPDLHPAPSLAGLATLADQAASAGVRIEMVMESRAADAVPQGVQLSAYRIVQEALTNVVKHAGAVACRVTVDIADDEVRIDVTDDGRGGRTERPGHGLVGMRERVAAYGGAFAAGPRPDGGFAVHATLPYPAR